MNVLLIIIAVWAVIAFVGIFSCSDRVNVAIRRSFGAPAIHIRGTSSAVKGDRWTAIVHYDAWGQPHAYRYPASRIGHVVLNADGTGEYCGSIEWKLA